MNKGIILAGIGILILILLSFCIGRESGKTKIREDNIVNTITSEIYKDTRLTDKEYYKKYPHLRAWRRILHNSLRKLGQTKETHTIDLLVYSVLELQNYITSLFTDGMSWQNYGEWHIDHIKPIISFPKDTPMNIVNALSNLRPMWATTREINGIVYEGNLNKGTKY